MNSHDRTASGQTSVHPLRPARWSIRPEGSNWGEFGVDDQLGRLNLLTPARTLRAAQEIRTGETFCLSLPLEYPGRQVLNPTRKPPQLRAVHRDGRAVFEMRLSSLNADYSDVMCDDAVLLHSQYSTQWDALSHVGAMFDATGCGEARPVFYNGWSVRDPATGSLSSGDVGACALGIEHMAQTGVQGRGVLVDLHAHFGPVRHLVGYEDLMRVMASDGVVIEEGDILCLHTGLGQLFMDMRGDPDPSVRTACAVLDGHDTRLLQWIEDSGLAAIAADNSAVEQSTHVRRESRGPGPALPLHEKCLFKLGIHLGELWYLTALARRLRKTNRNRFFLTAPPLRIAGAVGSPVNPVATL